MYGATSKKEIPDATHEILIDDAPGYQADPTGPIVSTLSTHSKKVGNGVISDVDNPLPLHFREYFPHGLMDANGKDVPLRALSGKLVCLYFVGSWVKPAKLLTPEVVRVRNLNRRVCEFVLVCNDKTQDVILKFMERYKIEFPALRQDNHQILNLFDQFKIMEMPKILVLNEIGNVVSEFGREAIEYNPDYCVNEWLDGKRGCSWFRATFPSLLP